MKISIAISILILLLAAIPAWDNHQRLVVVRADSEKLVAEAAKLGISTDSADHSEIARLRREREDHSTEAKAAAAEFIAFAKEMEAIQKKGGSPDEAMQERILEFMERMTALDSSQMKILIAEFRAATDITDETRQGLIGFTIMTLASNHPQAALAVLTQSADLFKNNQMGRHVITSALSSWAKDDPTGALEWIKTNGTSFPELVSDETKSGLLSGAAANDPKLAFQLIGELGFEDSHSAISAIIRAANTFGQRTETLSALRAHLANIKDDQLRDKTGKDALGQLAADAAKEGFEAGSQWISASDFTPAELESIASNGLFSHNLKSADTGKWIDWISTALPEDRSAHSISTMVGNWTRTDYKAAGEWLLEAPDGPAKITSIQAYATTVSSYEPAVAEEWALTLPSGKDRVSTLRTIHDRWPKTDEAGKAAFAEKHGIK